MFSKNQYATITGCDQGARDVIGFHLRISFKPGETDATKKFRNFKGSSFAVRRIADHLCIENGLSIVANPQPSKGAIYAKQKDGERLPTGRDRLRELMDENLIIGNSLTAVRQKNRGYQKVCYVQNYHTDKVQFAHRHPAKNPRGQG